MSSRWVPWQRMPSRYQLTKREGWVGDGEGPGSARPLLRPSSARLASPRHQNSNGTLSSVRLQGRSPGSETSLGPGVRESSSSKHFSLQLQTASNGSTTEGGNVACSPRGLPARNSAYIQTLKHQQWIATARRHMGEGRFVDVRPVGSAVARDSGEACADDSDGGGGGRPLHVVVGQGYEPHSPSGGSGNDVASDQHSLPSNGLTASPPMHVVIGYGDRPGSNPPGPGDSRSSGQQPGKPRHPATSPPQRIASPRQHVTSPRQRVITPREHVTTPRERVITPREPLITPRERVITPRERVTTPRGRVTTPRDLAITSRECVITPRERATTPREPATTPRENDVTTPRVRVTTPRKNDVTTPRERITTPRENVSTPRERVTTPRDNDVTTPREPVTTPRNCAATPREAVSGSGDPPSARYPRRRELRPRTSGGGEWRQDSSLWDPETGLPGPTGNTVTASHNRYPARNPRQRQVRSAGDRDRGNNRSRADGRHVTGVYVAQGRDPQPTPLQPQVIRCASSVGPVSRDDGGYMAQLRKEYLSRARDLSKTACRQSPKSPPPKPSPSQPQTPERSPKPLTGVMAQREEYNRRVGDILDYYTKVEVSRQLHGPRPPDAPHRFPPHATLPGKPAFRPLAARRRKPRGSSSAETRNSPSAAFSLDCEGCPFSPRKHALSPRPHSAREHESARLYSPRDASAVPHSAHEAKKSGVLTIPYGAGEAASLSGTEEQEASGPDPENFMRINVQARLHRRLHFYLQTPTSPEDIQHLQAGAVQHTVPGAATSTCTLCDLEREVASQGFLADNVAVDLDLLARVPLQDTGMRPHTAGHTFLPPPAEGEEFTREGLHPGPFGGESLVPHLQNLPADILEDGACGDDDYEDSDDDWPQVQEMKLTAEDSQSDAELRTETPPQSLSRDRKSARGLGSACIPEEGGLSGPTPQERGTAGTEEDTGSLGFGQAPGDEGSQLVDDTQNTGGSCVGSTHTREELECEEDGEGNGEGPSNVCNQWTQTPNPPSCSRNGCSHPNHKPFLTDWDTRDYTRS